MRSVQAIVTLSCALGVFASPVQAEQHLNARSPWSRRHGGRSNEHYARQENIDDIAVGPNTSVDPTTLTQSEVLPDFQSLLDAVIDPGSSTENPTPISTPPPDPVSSILSDILDPVSSVASEVVETLSSVASEVVETLSSVASEVVDPTSSSTEDPVVTPSSSVEVPPEPPSSSESISTPVEPSVVPSSQEPPPAPSSTSEIIVIPPPSSSSEPVIPSSSEEPVIPSSTPDPVPSSSTEPPPEPSSSEQPPLSSILSDLSSFLSSVVDPITDPPISSSTIIEEPPISSSTEEPPPPPSSSSEPPPPPPSSSSEPPPPPPSSSSEDPIISSSSTISVSVPSSSASSSSSAFDPDDIFPSGSSGVVSPSITLTSTSSLPPVELDSSIAGLLTETSFALATLSSSSSSITITDPDAPLSTVSSRSVAEDPRTLEVEKPVLPPNFPSSIAPQDAVASCVGDDTQINILFDDQVNWKHVTESKNVPEQMLAYLPRIVERCLSYDNGVVGVKGLEAFIPKDVEAVDGTVQDLTQLGTLFVGCIPTQGISTLESYIRDSRSCFYNSGNDVADQIAARVVKSYNIAQNRPNEDGDTISISNPNGTDHSRRNAIIGVCVAFGTIALGVFIWWLHKTRQQRREGAHRRLSYQSGPNYGTHINALGPQRGAPLMAETPGMRRNSFYAVGPDNESFEEETFDYMSQNSQNWGNNGVQRGPSYRRPVVGQPISQPILRETSMGNW